jgi:hypothetical protein
VVSKGKENFVMKNRYGDEYYYESIGDNKYRFVMSGTSMQYCRFGGKAGQSGIDSNDLGMFDPSGGPMVAVGGKVYWDEIKGGEKGAEPLIVKRISNTDEGMIVEVK